MCLTLFIKLFIFCRLPRNLEYALRDGVFLVNSNNHINKFNDILNLLKDAKQIDDTQYRIKINKNKQWMEKNFKDIEDWLQSREPNLLIV